MKSWLTCSWFDFRFKFVDSDFFYILPLSFLFLVTVAAIILIIITSLKLVSFGLLTLCLVLYELLWVVWQ